jgi:hypothetical protein
VSIRKANFLGFRNYENKKRKVIRKISFKFDAKNMKKKIVMKERKKEFFRIFAMK